MARPPRDSVDLRQVAHALEPLPLAGPDGFALSTQALITAMNSTALRESVMEASDFPLRDDMPAFLLLNQLVFRVTARPTDVADAIGTGRSNVSKIVRRLEKAGLVGRMPDPEDGRQTVIGLTAEGREVGARIVAVNGAGFEQLFDGWSDEDVAQLQRLMVRLVSDLDERLDHLIERVSGVRLPRLAEDRTD